ncbi:MAG: zinc permease [Actinomycetia bacterium]|nr:zinc permease [Actinomycetes bacterium]
MLGCPYLTTVSVPGEGHLSTARVVLLGAIAGGTIFLGLPVGRMQRSAPRLRAALNALTIGILIFLLWDVLAGAFNALEIALGKAQDGSGTWWRLTGLSSVFVLGLGLGLLGLVYFDAMMRKRGGREPRSLGAAAAPVTQPVERSAATMVRTNQAYRLALFIALGIGLHNFAEGLAIGQSAAKGEVSLALLLIIGFGLHNATEGFGIVAPLAGETTRPSWAFLLLMGLIGGAPTFLGTLVGQSFVNEAMYVAFLTLAAGSILYVVIQLLNVAARSGHTEVLMWGVLIGLIVGFATDMVVIAAGV